MATVLNRTTKALITSANTPDYSVAEWIIEPNLSAVNGFASIYWVITGDVVTLMDAPTRAAVDLAILNAQRDAVAAAMDRVEDYARAFALVVLDEFNRHTTLEADIFAATAAATNLANFQTRMAAVSQVQQRVIGDLKTALRNKLGT